MWNLIWPILIVVGANTAYNISAKSTPSNANAFLSLGVSYAIGMVLSALMFFVTSESKNIMAELSKLNWTSLLLGIAIVALEFGYICIYRTGLKISVATLITNISLAVVLMAVGVLFYRESISLKQIIGILVSAIGLILIAK